MNPIKYNTSTQSLALKKGNYWIGTGDVDKGPSVTSDYWAGISPVSGGYSIYLNRPGGISTVLGYNTIAGTVYNLSGGARPMISNYYPSFSGASGTATQISASVDPFAGSADFLLGLWEYDSGSGLWVKLDEVLVSGVASSGTSTPFTISGSISASIVSGRDYRITCLGSSGYNIRYDTVPGTASYDDYFASFSTGSTLSPSVFTDSAPYQSTLWVDYTTLGGSVPFNVFCVSNANELVNITNNILFTTFTIVEQCLTYFATQSNIMVINRDYEAISTNGLVLNLDAGMVSSYPATSSVWYDISVSSKTASLQNGAYWLDTGYMISDGVNDGIEMKDHSAISFTGSVNFSCEVWVMLNSYKDISIVMGKGDGGGVSTNYNYMFIGTNTSFYFRVSDGVTTINSPSIGSSNLPTGAWGHVVGVLDSSKIRLYLNGTEVSTGTTRTINPKSNTNSLWLNAPVYPLNGNISMSRIYNRDLSVTEVRSNYQSTLSRFTGVVTTGLSLYLDGGNLSSYSGATAWNDISGYKNDATLLGGATYSTLGGGSIYLDGTNDYIETKSFALSNNGGYLTFDTWFNLPSAPAQITSIFGDGAQSNTVGYLWCYFVGTQATRDRITFQYATDTTRGDFTLLDYMTDSYNTWVNLTLVIGYDTKTYVAYKNGLTYSTGSLSGNIISFPSANRTKQLGSYGSLQSFSNIYFGDFRIYERPLSHTDISQNFNSKRTRYGL